MRAEIALARMTAGSVWRTGQEGGCGVPAISRAELRGALAGLPMGPTKLALLMWCFDYGELPGAEEALLLEITGWERVMREYRQRKHGRGVLIGLCRVAIFEVATPAMCPRCGGTALTPTGKDCNLCEGTGHKRATSRVCAEIASHHHPMSKDTWLRHSRAYDYESIHAKANDWRNEALRHIWRSLRE